MAVLHRCPGLGPALVLDRKSALSVLAYLVGDLHQPLHVGAIYYDKTCQRVVDPNVLGAGQPNFGIGSKIFLPTAATIYTLRTEIVSMSPIGTMGP